MQKHAIYFINIYGEYLYTKSMEELANAIVDDWYWNDTQINQAHRTLQDLSSDLYNLVILKQSLSMDYEGIVSNLKEIYIKKNQDYGDSFKKSLEAFGTIALRVRLFDKAMRLKTLLNSNEIAVKDETIEDTVMDFINYCIMGYMELNNMEEE